MNEPTQTGPIQDTQPPEPQPAGVRLAVPDHSPLWTYVFLGLIGLAFVAMTLSGGSEDPYVLLQFGAKWNPAIAAGEYWRLLTASFLHVGLLHLVFNAYALFSFGVALERRFGRARFFSLYLLSAIAGTTLSFLGNRSLSAGASTAVFGIIGAMIAYFATYRTELGAWGRRQLNSMLGVAGLNLVFGFVAPGIDNLGHIGGLLAGLALGWAYCPRYKVAAGLPGQAPLRLVDRYARPKAWLVTIGVVLVLVAAVVVGTLVQVSSLG
ncbi:MAG: rhomboid family intramembrane serine protease [Anaerolineae bacterium]